MGYPERMSEFRESDLPEQERVRRRQLDKLHRELRNQMDLEGSDTFIKGVATRIFTMEQENERLQADVQRLEPLAVLDSLITDFFRHSHFLHLLDKEVETANTMPQSTSALITIDLDSLRDFNNTFGHLAGDELLKTVGVSILKSIRHGDTPGRIGGDEMAIIQRRTTIEGAVAAARRIQATLLQASEEKFPEAGGSQTVSIGICLIKPSHSVKLLRDISDMALYASKEAGRNSISIGEYDPEAQSIKTILVAPKVNGGGK